MQPFSTTNIQEISLDQLLRQAVAAGYALAAWRMPGETTAELLMQFSSEVAQVFPELETLAPGFLFSPYASDYQQPESQHCRYIRGDALFRLEQGKVSIPEEFAEEKLTHYARLIATTKDEGSDSGWYMPKHRQHTSASQAAYEELVAKAIAAIEAGKMQKVVCARAKQSNLPANFSLAAFFQRLCAAYPHAFVSLVAIPNEGTWVGATPETLISLRDKQHFTTMALAGTQAKQVDQELSDAVWRQKEIEEQALVSRYIINCFKKIRLREFEEIGPRTVAAANLMHLRTDFKVDMQATNFPNLGTTMLQLLHPTSAVCGMPKDKAIDFLDTHEALNRSYFAGFLGPVNVHGLTQVFVNLRCMQLLENEAILYAGAGITADSNPQREWLETELKCQTLLAQLQVTQAP